MMSHPWDDDAALLADLHAALRDTKPAPAAMIEAGIAALAWRTVDADLAGVAASTASGDSADVPAPAGRCRPTVLPLRYDSACDRAMAARTRTADPARMLVFGGDQFTIELEVSATGLVGQVIAAGEASGEAAGDTPEAAVDTRDTGDAVAKRIEWQTPDGTSVATTVDPGGYFLLPQPSPGPARLLVRTGTAAVVTSWVCLT
jgi:hypothetical protein